MNGKKKEKKNLLCNLLIMWMVLCSSNSLITQNIFSLKAINIVNFILVFFVFVFRKKRKLNNDVNLRILLFLLALILITMIVTFDIGNVGGYLLIAFQIIQMYFLVNTFDCDEIQSSYVNALLHIAISSIIVTYILPIGGLDRFLPKIVNIHDLKFRWLLFSAKLEAPGNFGIRNYGIFSEPAAYCLYLFIAMYFVLKMDSDLKYKIWYIFIFAFVSFTTMSPIGMIIGLAFVLIISLVAFNKKCVSDRILIVVLFVIALFSISIFSVFNDALYYILNKTNIESGSGLVRSEAVFANLILWLNRPVFGNGLKGISYLTSIIGSNTSTSGVMLACFGTFFSIISFVTQIINIWQYCDMKPLFRIIVVLMFFLVINNYGFIQAEWYWFFCFKLCNAKKPTSKNRESN